MTLHARDPQVAGEMRSIRAVDRAFDLVAAVTDAPAGGASLSELARATELSPATASRLLTTLARRRLVRRDQQGNFRPGSELMQMAGALLRSDPLYELAGEHLARLAAASGETANLAVAVDLDRALYLRQISGAHGVITTSWANRTIPRDGTAIGAALAGRTNPAGYTVSRALLEPDVTAVAAAVRDYGEVVVAALGIVAPSYRTTDIDVEHYGDLVAAQAADLSRALGA